MKTIDDTISENYGLQLAEPELLKKIQKLPNQDLNWLSGFCAGLAISDAKPKLDTKSITQSASANILVLYASQSGNAQSIAESLHSALSSKNIAVDLKAADQIKLKQFKNYTTLLLIASTHGEGEAPDSSIDLLELIQSKKAPSLSHLKHAVLALGDSSYEFYCQTGKDFEQEFFKLKSTALLERIDCDIDFEEQAEQWIKQVVIKLETSNPAQVNHIVQGTVQQINHQKNSFSRNNPFKATVLSVQKITGKGSIKQTYHLELSIENSGIDYSPGDSLGIWPKNDPELVAQLINQTQLDAKQIIGYKNKSYQLSELLISELELTLLSRKLLTAYNDIAKNPKLERIITDNIQAYIEHHQFIDLLIDFPISLSVEQLTSLLSPLKPRLYSIASALVEAEDEVHLTINAVSEVNTNGIRKGTGSNFLIHRLSEDDEVDIYLDDNPNFKLPTDDKNIILIGPGTGIAPFRSFLQQRDVSEATGKNWLFFGNPNFNSDFLYQTELKQYLTSGILTKLDLAFSRDQKNKIYVQHKLLEQAAEIWRWLEKEQAYLYVCGDIKRMAKDVEQALLEIIQTEGHLTALEAKEYLNALRKNKRYQRDVY